jgi:hypothetical protein
MTTQQGSYVRTFLCLFADKPLDDLELTTAAIHSWFWYPGEDHAAQPVDRLIRMYRESVGHKRIESFNPVEVSRVRLRVTQARATPRIRCLAV